MLEIVQGTTYYFILLLDGLRFLERIWRPRRVAGAINLYRRRVSLILKKIRKCFNISWFAGRFYTLPLLLLTYFLILVYSFTNLPSWFYFLRYNSYLSNIKTNLFFYLETTFHKYYLVPDSFLFVTFLYRELVYTQTFLFPFSKVFIPSSLFLPLPVATLLLWKNDIKI